MPFFIVRNDIAKMDTDVVVNAANTQLRLGGGVAGAIATAAGRDELQAACDAIGSCPTGSAVATPGFGLGASYVIHAVGPVWQGGSAGEAELLRSCYDCSLALASQIEARSIAFPLISAGTFGFPAEEAFRIAADAITCFLETHEMDVYLVLYGIHATFLGRKLQEDLREFIDDVYIEEHPNPPSRRIEEEHWFTQVEDAMPTAASTPLAASIPSPAADDLSSWLEHLDASFTSTLLQLIDRKGMNDAEVYKRANISRQLFSKIRSDEFYQPTKKTALALAIGLQLTLDEACDLLARAGFALTRSNVADCIIEFFINRKEYDIITINQALYAYDQTLLGS